MKSIFSPANKTSNASLAVPQMKSLNDMSSIVPQMYAAWGAYGYLPSITWYQLANMYVSWTFTAINKKATTIASLPVQLYRYESRQTGKTVLPFAIKQALYSCNSAYSGEEKTWKVLKNMGVKRVQIEEHPCLDLLNDPNPDMVRSNFWHLLCVHLLLNGSVGIYKARRDVFGNPLELHVLPTTWTGNLKPLPGNGKTVIGGYKLIDLDIQEDFDKEEVIWPHFPSLRNPYEGMSPVKANLYGFDIDQYLLQQTSAFYKNSAMYSNVLSTDQVLTQPVYDDVKKQVQAYQGAKNSGQMFVTHGGMKFINPLQSTARDSMIVEIDKMTRERLLAGEDVSEGKLGLTSTQNRSNLQTVNENFFNEAIRPTALMLTEYLDKHLVSNYDKRLSFEFGYPSFEDRAANLAEKMANLSSGYSTINEERQNDGLGPVPWGDVPLINSSMMPLGEHPTPAKPPTEETGAEPIEKNYKTKAFWTTEKKAMAWKAFDKKVTAYEKQFEKAAIKHFKFVEGFIIDKLESNGVKIKANMQAMSRQHKLDYMGENKEKLSDFIPSKNQLKVSIKNIFTPIYELTLQEAAADRADQLDMELNFNMNSKNVEEWLGTRMEEFSKNVSDTTIKNTKDLLREDFANGESLVNMTDHLKDLFTGNEDRAHVIARTEATAAYNKGDLEAVDQLGIQLVKIWLAEPTARDTHAQAGEDYADGIPLEDDFKVGADTMQAPGNGDLPEENCNCRCSMVYERP